jgi:predicted nucleic acid-binding protein
VAVALDTSAVVGFLDQGDDLHVAARAAISRILGARQRLVISAVAYAEVLTGAKLGRQDETGVRQFFSDFAIEVLAVDRVASERAAELRAGRRSLQLADALLLASAELEKGVDRLLSGDRRLAKIDTDDLSVDLLTV